MTGNPSPVPGQEALETDPVINGALPGTSGGCRVMNTTTDPDVAAWTWSPATPVTLAGAPAVLVTVTLHGTDAELAARLWDVDPATGKQALITRGIYRLTASAPGATTRVAFELWPTAWPLLRGHQLKLEISPDDSPTWQPSDLPGTMTLAGVSLTIPVRQRAAATSAVAPAASRAQQGNQVNGAFCWLPARSDSWLPQSTAAFFSKSGIYLSKNRCG